MKNEIIQGDTLETLKQLPDESVDCIITSPPYWFLRDYGVADQIGLERTFQKYLEKLWQVFDEAKRVLKKEGTCWVNIGDTYNGNKPGNTDLKNRNVNNNKYKKEAKRIKKKSLLLIPSRFAIGMIERGWILRNEIIWKKDNAMPSSARDRFTVNFEKIFFFVKQKKYYFEQQLELADYDGRITTTLSPTKKYGNRNYPINNPQQMARKPMERWPNKIKGKPARNKRAVWTVNTKPFKEAHFAVFPEKLVEPMIKAGCPKEGIVLDPFAGAGTTCLVAKKLGRDYIGIELNPEYVKMSEQRIGYTLF